MNIVALLVVLLFLALGGAVVAIAVGIGVRLLVALRRPSPRTPAAPPAFVSDWDDDDEIAARHHLHDL